MKPKAVYGLLFFFYLKCIDERSKCLYSFNINVLPNRIKLEQNAMNIEKVH